MRGTPSFISRHEINVAPWQAPVLRARERAGHSIYVYTLGILESRVNILRNDREYMALARKKDKTEEDKDNRIFLFVRKNKDDNEAKEFYFLGEIFAENAPRPIRMEKTKDDAFEIDYRLDVPVRSDIYDYIVSD